MSVLDWIVLGLIVAAVVLLVALGYFVMSVLTDLAQLLRSVTP